MKNETNHSPRNQTLANLEAAKKEVARIQKEIEAMELACKDNAVVNFGHVGSAAHLKCQLADVGFTARNR